MATRLSFMVLDDDVVAVSPSTTFRVLLAAGRLDLQWPGVEGAHHFRPAFRAAQDWHIDVS